MELRNQSSKIPSFPIYPPVPLSGALDAEAPARQPRRGSSFLRAFRQIAAHATYVIYTKLFWNIMLRRILFIFVHQSLSVQRHFQRSQS